MHVTLTTTLSLRLSLSHSLSLFTSHPLTLSIPLGDFRTASGSANIGAASAQAKTDYEYDINGNLLKDLNKEISGLQTSGIQNNHLNLPDQVSVNNKGTITYIVLQLKEVGGFYRDAFAEKNFSFTTHFSAKLNTSNFF